MPYGFIEKLKHLPVIGKYCGGQECDFCGEGYSTCTMIVIGENDKIYITPQMIAHYVEIHNYKPPQEFIEAVMKMDMTDVEARQVLNRKMRKHQGDLPFSKYMDSIRIKK